MASERELIEPVAAAIVGRDEMRRHETGALTASATLERSLGQNNNTWTTIKPGRRDHGDQTRG